MNNENIIDVEVVKEEAIDVETIPPSDVCSEQELFEKIKEALSKYQFDLVRYYTIGNEAEITTSGRSNPLTQSEMQELCKVLELPFLMVSFSDANFTWRVFYTVDATAIAALD